ncbi:MAG: CinA family protein [Deltaproteobacteria bacterium]|nr:CinA family protein [Deltaproteobacteria bacterium]
MNDPAALSLSCAAGEGRGEGLSCMDTASLIARIHASPVMAVLVVTGGGAQALADLLAVPGASRTLLEAIVPYSEKSLSEFLGGPPAQAVSVATAAALAQAAYRRAVRLRDNETVPVLGLSCTATLVTDRPKKGAHRAHIGLCDGKRTEAYSLTLQKGAQDRQGEERVVSDLILRALAEACGLTVAGDVALLPEERVTVQDV